MFGGQIMIGTGMIALTVVIHVVGIIVLIAALRSRARPYFQRPTYPAMVVILVVVVLALFVFHTVEIWTWAALYIWIGEFDHLQTALYFSTLGFGDIVLGERWQLLSAFESINGIILVGVSTAFVFAIIERLYDAAAGNSS